MSELSTDVVRGRYCDGTFHQTGTTTDGAGFDRWLDQVRADAVREGRIATYRERATALREAWNEWGDVNDVVQAEALDAAADALSANTGRES